MRARNNLHGISLLGPKALKCVPGFSLSRMHILQDADANAGLTQSKFRVAVDASHALAALSKWRVDNVYSCAWPPPGSTLGRRELGRTTAWRANTAPCTQMTDRYRRWTRKSDVGN